MANAQAQTKNHDYHLVDPSPWPVVGSISAFVMAVGAIMWMHDILPVWLFLAGVVGDALHHVRLVVRCDRRGQFRQATTPRSCRCHHRYGMILFIASEVMFFVAWFWAYFDIFFGYDSLNQVSRVAATGGVWPPQGVELFDPWHLPLFNTLLLLTSGTTVTWAHHALIENDRDGMKWGLALTIALGALFSVVQAIEYSTAGFSFSGNTYGAAFFMATGFHGFHVFVGTIFLLVNLIRTMKGDFTPKTHLGFEFGAWYWHFVDVVWLFLFASIYVWGSWGGALAIHHG